MMALGFILEVRPVIKKATRGFSNTTDHRTAALMANLPN